MKKGDKYIIEIADVMTAKSDDGKVYPVARIKGFNALVMDEFALSRFKKLEETQATVNEIKHLDCEFVVTKKDIKSQGIKVGNVYKVDNGRFIASDGLCYPLNGCVESFEGLTKYFDVDSDYTWHFGGHTEIALIER